MKYLRNIYWGILSTILFPTASLFAQGSPGGGTGPVGPPQPVTIKFTNPLKGANTLQELVPKILNEIVLPIGAVVVVFLIIYSGFLFVTARGNEAQLTKAKQNFLWVVIGAAVLLGSWAIAQAISGTVNQLTQP